MPKYHVVVDVEHATGSQTFEVEASSPQEAVQKVNQGKGKFIDEEIEVRSWDDPQWWDVYEVDSPERG